MAESKHFQGSHRFSWPVQIQVQPFAKALAGEVRILEGEGHFGLEFEDREHRGVVGFGVRDFEVRVPSFRTYVGSGRLKTAITIPAFTVSGSRFKAAHGFLETSTGRFVLSLSLEITEKEAPFLPELQRLNLLLGFDVSTLTAHLFESGRIDPKSGQFDATGTLYIGDKNWRSPKDPSLLIIRADQDGCNVAADLKGTVQAGAPNVVLGTNLVVCPGDPVTLVYLTQNAKTATLIGTDGTSLNLGPPDHGQATVVPKATGEVRYHVHASDGCSADSDDVVVLVVTPHTLDHVTATLTQLTSDPTAPPSYGWTVDFTNFASRRVVVESISMDTNPALNHPVDFGGNEITSWLGIDEIKGSLFNTPTFGLFQVPLTPPLQLAGFWTFLPQPVVAIDPSDPRNQTAHFIMELNCSS
jgi:hypothetical protein